MRSRLRLSALNAGVLTQSRRRHDDRGTSRPPVFDDVKIGKDEHKRYLLHGPSKDAEAPKDGWKLLVVMPGGNGNEEFAPFVGRIRKNALGADWIIAQMIAPVWSEEQAKDLVWPTKRSPWPKMKFTCEELFADVVEDVGKTRKLDPRYLFTLAWSSSGTLAYTLALEEKTPVTGSFIAMSVYKPNELPNLKGAKGKNLYLLQSPEDFIPISMAEDAVKELTKKGANVELKKYEGGHGWHGNIYGMMKDGFAWLDARVTETKTPTKR